MEMILMTVNNQSVNNRQYNNKYSKYTEHNITSNLVINVQHQLLQEGNWKKEKNNGN